jgi:hypothetical protein
MVVALDTLLEGFGSGVAEAIVAVEVNCVPEAVPLGTLTVRLNVVMDPAAYAPLARHVAVVAVSEQLQPEGFGKDTNVVPGGMVMVIPAPVAADGP